jgi:hypothetical protein
LHLLFAILLISISGMPFCGASHCAHFLALMAVLMRSYLSQDAMYVCDSNALVFLTLRALKVQMSGGTPTEQKHATMIYPIVQKHYLLLVTYSPITAIICSHF